MSDTHVYSSALEEMSALTKHLLKRFRTDHALMPIVVFEAEKKKDQAAVGRLVDDLHSDLARGDLICFPGQSDPDRTAGRQQGKTGASDPYEAAFDLMTLMCTSESWSRSGLPRYRQLSFPRSQLIQAISDAATTNPSRPLSALHRQRWRPVVERENGNKWWNGFMPFADPGTLAGTALVVVLGALLTQSTWITTLLVISVALVLFVLWHLLAPFRPQLLWFSPVNRWFTRTTFLVTGQSETYGKPWSLWHPQRSGKVMKQRAEALARSFSTVVAQRTGANSPVGPGRSVRRKASDGFLALVRPVMPRADHTADPARANADPDSTKRYLLQLRTLALLEDLQAHYRPRTLDLRRRKRPTPPVLFLPRATESEGQIALLGAINDVRCRRSEVDPLLVIAGSDNDSLKTLTERQSRTLPKPPDARSDDDVYTLWVEGLQLGQSPDGLPWLLSQTIRHDDLARRGNREEPPHEPALPLWLKLWSVWTLIVVVTLGLAFTVRAGMIKERHYCDSRIVFGNHDLRRVHDLVGSGYECIGVTAGAHPFDDGGFFLNGGAPQDPGDGPGRGVTLSTVERWITTSNASIGNSPHITVVYAGPLSTWQDPGQVRNGLEELAGVYLAQNYANTGHMDGPKIRVLMANGGQELRHQYLMAQQIVRKAQQDPTITAVVGLGRDTDDSAKTVQLLERNGLAVVDTTNSSPTLAQNANYFGLAANDNEEAVALVNQITKQLKPTSPRPTALVVTRTQAGTDDQYSPKQKTAATTALSKAGYQVAPIEYTSGSNISFATAINTICSAKPQVIYLAGRSDEFSALLSSISNSGSCTEPLDLLTGDDLTKVDLDTIASIPSNITVFFTGLADPSVTGQHSNLLTSERAVWQLSRYNPKTATKTQTLAQRILDEPMFNDGTLAVAFEAIEIVQNAADSSDAVNNGYRSAVLAQLGRTLIANQPTGQVDFRDFSQTGTETGHGIVIDKVTTGDGTQPSVTTVCDTLSGTRRLQPAPPAPGTKKTPFCDLRTVHKTP